MRLRCDLVPISWLSVLLGEIKNCVELIPGQCHRDHVVGRPHSSSSMTSPSSRSASASSRDRLERRFCARKRIERWKRPLSGRDCSCRLLHTAPWLLHPGPPIRPAQRLTVVASVGKGRPVRSRKCKGAGRPPKSEDQQAGCRQRGTEISSPLRRSKAVLRGRVNLNLCLADALIVDWNRRRRRLLALRC